MAYGVSGTGSTLAVTVTLSFIALGGLSLLNAVQTWVLTYPEGSFSRALFPWVFGGFYLDEIFTRLTVRWWPPRIKSAHSTPRLLAIIEGGKA